MSEKKFLHKGFGQAGGEETLPIDIESDKKTLKEQ